MAAPKNAQKHKDENEKNKRDRKRTNCTGIDMHERAQMYFKKCGSFAIKHSQSNSTFLKAIHFPLDREQIEKKKMH